jgi:hypothetical protein
MEPAIAFYLLNGLEGDGVVDKVQVQVIDLKIFKGSLKSRSDILRSVESVPQFRYDK